MKYILEVHMPDKKYDYLIVGAGLFGACFAREMTDAGKTCLVIEKEDHIAGHCHTEKVEGIDVHVYGAHIFHTYSKVVWEYVQRFAEFNRFTNSPLANYKGKMYNMPFNMNTFYALWGARTPLEAKEIIDRQRSEIRAEPQNLEEQAIKLVGRDIFEKLIKDYTEKQWGKSCKDLPAFIIKRLPVRFTYDNNYFNDPYQGIPVEGYDALVEEILQGVEVKLSTDFFANKDEFLSMADKVVYTGPIDAFFDYCYGPLEWRSLEFETEILNIENYQGVAVVNYTDADSRFTRIIEHKHFNFGEQEKTVITREYPKDWKLGMEPYYPVNDEKNAELFNKYQELANKEENVIFGGRLAEYRYYNMDQVIASALELSSKEKSSFKE